MGERFNYTINFQPKFDINGEFNFLFFFYYILSYSLASSDIQRNGSWSIMIIKL